MSTHIIAPRRFLLALSLLQTITIVSLATAVPPAGTPSLSVTASPPETNIAVNQPLAAPAGADAGEIQTRWVKDAEFRGVTQDFVWESDVPLATIGLRISPEQNKRFKFFQPQKYALDVQELSENRIILKTLASLEFTLEPAFVQSEKYLIVTPAATIPLTSGGHYGFHLRPLEQNNRNRLLLSTGGRRTGDSFSGGAAMQTNVSGLVSAGVRYGNASADFDVTFFLAAKAGK
ncbi:hypothetical protein Ga0100231_012685 [Opitutaceae bacterium TAV4]|nr:hypothetical protein Ga0100231_012685 [Opitutaceae bacterium TAV4]RRJ99297.1 hypothetical protein Ga0100230_013970 [Opitutaceae bacterium TAV3]